MARAVMLSGYRLFLHNGGRSAKAKLLEALLASGLCLLAACGAATGAVVRLPANANLIRISPNLEWVTYEHEGAVWLAPLADLDEAVVLVHGDDPLAWSMHVSWMPDSSGLLLKSRDVAAMRETWWLAPVDEPGVRTRLCELPTRERAVLWSPTGQTVALIARGGDVTLIWAGGGGCEELPIPGLVMKTLSLSWSPDGQEIAYVHVPREGPGSAEVRSYHINTQETRTIYNRGGLPNWFSKGDAIALLGWSGVIPIVHSDGSGLLGTVKVPAGYMIGPTSDIKVSPEGSRLAIPLEPEKRDDAPEAVGILDGGTLAILVIEAPSYLEIAGWTPDGERVAILVAEGDGTMVLRELEVR
jgi:dipeptidyl aminopeptidase/acylaminoacyl peptidase